MITSPTTPQKSILRRRLLPKYIYVRASAPKEKDHMYLCRSSGGLNFRKGPANQQCVWEVIERRDLGDDMITLKGDNDTYISRNDDGWLFYSRGNNQACALNVTYTMDNAFVYITVPSNNSRFLVPRNNWLRTKVHLCLGPALDKWKFEIIEPVIRRDIHDVVYQTSNTIPDLNPPHVTSLQPLVVFETIVSNASTAAENRQTSTYTYKKTESATWTDKIGITYGWNITFHADVPLLIGGLNSDYQISMSSTKEHRWGHTHEEAVEVSSSTEITVPAGKQVRAKVIVYRSDLRVEFTYKETVVYKDGTVRTFDRVGVYTGIDAYRVDVEVDDWKTIVPKPLRAKSGWWRRWRRRLHM
jgi:hypothetical protein